ncbi:hypothetical protein WJX73_006250 [Symbiochloris irregularis]|uniref:PX domain-containing protein n=1 Tax=Symbiochloris irregularis TaxID=706552 RepID=A0AAW1PU59_9CHLO
MSAAQIPDGWAFSASIPSWTQTTLEGDELVVFYRVEVKVLPPDKNGAPRCRSVLRRFSHFKKLHGRLIEELGAARLQGLAPPRKGGFFATVNKQPALIERRRRELQEWLYALIRDPAIAHSRMLNNFLELADAARFVQRHTRDMRESFTGTGTSSARPSDSYVPPRLSEAPSFAGPPSARSTQTAAGGPPNMRLGLHVEQRGGLKKHVRALKQRLDRASADLQDAVEVIAAEREGKRQLVSHLAALEARVSDNSGKRSAELDRLLSQVSEIDVLIGDHQREPASAHTSSPQQSHPPQSSIHTDEIRELRMRLETAESALAQSSQQGEDSEELAEKLRKAEEAAESLRGELGVAKAQLGVLAKDGETMAELREQLGRERSAKDDAVARADALAQANSQAAEASAQLQAAAGRAQDLEQQLQAAQSEAERLTAALQDERGRAQEAAAQLTQQGADDKAKLLSDMKVLAREAAEAEAAAKLESAVTSARAEGDQRMELASAGLKAEAARQMEERLKLKPGEKRQALTWNGQQRQRPG